MGKNYTLYIQAEVRKLFDEEENKSGLVTWLLENHYENIKPGSFKEISRNKKSVKVEEEAAKKAIRADEAASGMFNLCKHNKASNQCKAFGCKNYN